MSDLAGRELWFLANRVSIRIASEDGSDDIAILDFRAPGGDSPPLHVHRNETEIFHILEGTFRFRLGEEERSASAGDIFAAPVGIPHTYRIESEGGGRFLTITGAGDFEGFVRAVGRPAEAPGLPPDPGPPSPAQVEALSEAALEHGLEILGPPLS